MARKPKERVVTDSSVKSGRQIREENKKLGCAGDSNDSNSSTESYTCCGVLTDLVPHHWADFDVKYTYVSLILNLASIAMYIADFVTDWLNAFLAYYFQMEERGSDYRFYFWLTVSVITVPSLVIQVFSIVVEIEEYRHKETMTRWYYYPWLVIFHLLQLGPVFRYIRAIYYGIKSSCMNVAKNEEKQKFYYEEYALQKSDASFARLLEAYLEAAPQVMLQFYIIVKTLDLVPITVVSICFSGLGMSLAVVTHQRSLRSASKDKIQLSILASIFLFLYHNCFNLSRVLSLALLLNTSVLAWLIGLVVHWIIMFYFIRLKRTDFCGNSKCKEAFYQVVLGFCYIFSYVNVHLRGVNFTRMLIYYTLMCIENAVIVVVWFAYRNKGSLLAEFGDQGLPEIISSQPNQLAVILVVVISFLLGVALMAFFYLFLHPTTRRFRRTTRNELDHSAQCQATKNSFMHRLAAESRV